MPLVGWVATANTESTSYSAQYTCSALKTALHSVCFKSEVIYV